MASLIFNPTLIFFAVLVHFPLIRSEASTDLTNSLKTLSTAVQRMEDKLEQILKMQETTKSSLQQMSLWEKQVEQLGKQQHNTQLEQNQMMDKMTALDFTLNHVLSKVVYLSDNFPTAAIPHVEVAPSSKPLSAQNDDVDREILSRFDHVLLKLKNIERNNCRRSSIPAAAGPIIMEKSDVHFMTKSQSPVFDVEEFLSKLDSRMLVQKSGQSILEKLPNLVKKNGQQLERVLESITQLSTDNSHQQNWHNMLEYCQRISDEFSTFSGSSDNLMKRIESIVHDTKERLDKLQIDVENDDSTMCDKKKMKVPTVHDGAVSRNNDTEGKYLTTKSVEKKVFLAHDKSGCDELIYGVDVDGIYEFLEVDLNDAQRNFNQRLCSFAEDTTAWTVIQRRGPYDVQENFNRSWADYRDGFGDLSKDFWYGNEFIHRLTYANNCELLIELESFDDGAMSFLYGHFAVDSESFNYNLNIGDFKGTSYDSMLYHNFMDFSTFDRPKSNENTSDCCTCAVGYGSGWWFDNCFEANLNGVYQTKPLDRNYLGIVWQKWLGDQPLKAARMLIRPKNLTAVKLNTDHEDP